jgi:acyl carrier protein
VSTDDRAAIVTALRRHVVELSEGRLSLERVDARAKMFDHGYVDSMSAVMLLAFVDETWGVEIDDTELLGTAATIEGLAGLVHARRG